MKWIAAALAGSILVFSCMSGKISSYEAGPEAFTLQLIHFSDIDGNEEIALASVDEFSALVDGFSNDPVYGASTTVHGPPLPRMLPLSAELPTKKL